MAKLTALLALNTAHFQAGLKNAAREIGAFKKNVDGASGMGKGFAGIGTALGASIAAGVAVAGASIAVVGKSISSAADFEQTKVAFTTLIGDAGHPTTKGLFSTLKDTVNEAFLALGQL